MNIKDSFPLGWTGWISLQSKGLSRVLQHHYSKVSILQWSAFFPVQLSHPYMTTGKTIALTRRTFVGKVISLLFNMLSRLVMEMATHSSIFAWKIPWTEEPGRLWSMGPQRVGHDWVTSLHEVGHKFPSKEILHNWSFIDPLSNNSHFSTPCPSHC